MSEIITGAVTALTGLIVFLVIFIVVACITALPVMWLWDWLMPTLFGLHEITLVQAWGLALLCSCLFKGNSVKASS